MNPSSILKWRNLSAFWIFGLANNFAYVIMLSAADDILTKQGGGDSRNSSTEGSNDRNCTIVSTGAVLLADILPTLAIKLTAPLYILHIPYGIRIAFVILCQIASYLITANSGTVAVSLFGMLLPRNYNITGVVCASVGAGLGEITFLSLASHFDASTITAWSSGTGGAGIFGSLAYAALTEWLTPNDTLYVMLVVPVAFALAYWLLLERPASVATASLTQPKTWWITAHRDPLPSILFGEDRDRGEYQVLQHASDDEEAEDEPAEPKPHDSVELTLGEKLRLIVPLLKYMIPLGVVYAGEYLINQGFTQLLIFNNIAWPSTKEGQYRWYQVLYQLGVFVSRSSRAFIKLPYFLLPLLAILQCANAVLFFTEALYLYIPNIFIIFALIFYEGLLGGAAYVNTFGMIREKVSPSVVEYSLGVASVADSMGVVAAGFAAIPIHNWVCKQAI